MGIIKVDDCRRISDEQKRVRTYKTAQCKRLGRYSCNDMGIDIRILISIPISNVITTSIPQLHELKIGNCSAIPYLFCVPRSTTIAVLRVTMTDGKKLLYKNLFTAHNVDSCVGYLFNAAACNVKDSLGTILCA